MRTPRPSIIAFAIVLSLSVIPLGQPVSASYGKDTTVAAAQATFWGDSSMVFSGTSVAIVGDVNGDGYDDMVVGEPSAVGAGPAVSKAFLILGKASGWSKDQTLGKVAVASFLSEAAGDSVGKSVAPAGDVNGDGYSDFLIAAPTGDAGGQDAGQVYLILGKASGWTMNTPLGKVDASFVGTATFENVGSSIASGDVNGDGYSDIIIGATGNNDAGDHAGKVYVFFGKASGWAMNTQVTSSDASYTGESASDMAGISVASGGDLNGDHLADIIVGAQMAVGPGKAYVIFGKSSGWTNGNSLGKSSASYIGMANKDCAGCSVAVAGDVNGDGRDDLLIGAPQTMIGTFPNGGRTYLIFGKTNGWAQGVNLSTADVKLNGEGLNDYSGQRLAGGSDLNGDGYSDFVIAAPQRIQGSTGQKGEVYVIRGKASGWADISLVNADSSFWAETAIDSLGDSVSTGGDVDGDGHADILMGSSSNSEGGNNCGQTYLLFYDRATPPLTVQSVKAYTAADYKNETKFALPGDTVYVELRGSDQNASRADLVVLNASSDSSMVPIHMELRETGLSTGIYRGPLMLGNKTIDPRLGTHEVKAKDGDKVRLAFIKDATKNDTLTVGRIALVPALDNTTAIEDKAYSAHYSAANATAATWTFGSNATWLKWDPLARNVSGTPTNANVGKFYVRVNATDLMGRSAQHNFTLTVSNVPPTITTTDVTVAVQDKPYRVDYNSSDDGNGTITWSLSSNASWLKINTTTGVINGTPGNADVGRPYVNVTVNDGHGGKANHYFVLDVRNANDPPRINTTALPPATQGQAYSTTIQAYDPDLGDTMTWSMATNASWLRLNSTTGILSGTPSNADVGWSYVNITVSDKAHANVWRNLTLSIINVNDPPVWANVPKNTTMDRASTYTFDVNATDPDKGDTVAYQLSVTPTTATASINVSSGVITWRPDGSGNYTLDVLATDGKLSIHHIFKIVVRPPVIPNHPPTIVAVGPQKGRAGKAYSLLIQANDIDVGDKLNFSILAPPQGMTISSTGNIDWNPTKDQIGAHNITVQVSDGKAMTNMSFLLTVEKAPSTSNEVDKIILPGLGITLAGLGVAGAAYAIKSQASKQNQNKKDDKDDDNDELDIDEILLVHRDGRLIGHEAKEGEKPSDEIAHKVKTAIKKHYEEGKTLESTVLSSGGNYVMFQKGTDTYLVAVVPGTTSFNVGALKSHIKLSRALDSFEKENKEALKAWNGDPEGLKKVDDTLGDLV